MIRLVDPTLTPGVIWLVTYLLHSTLWVAGVVLLGWLVPALPGRARSLLWRTALLGPLLSASLQAGAGARWSVGSVSLDAEPAPVLAAPVVIDLTAPAPMPLIEAAPPAVVVAPVAPAPVPVWAWFAATAALIGAARLGLLARTGLRLRRDLGQRRRVSDPRLRHTFARLRAGLSRPVAAHLTESEQLASPIALGASEVCLPTRAQTLDDRALAAVLGHELAHLERRDNLWLMLGAVIEAVFFFQPLNRLARRGLQESAELASDERAVELTDDPLGLARSLAEVAAWGLGPDASGLASPVVSERGALLRRVRALLDGKRHRGARWQGPLLVAGLAALALALPSLGAEVQAAAPPDAPIDVAVVPPAPVPPVKVEAVEPVPLAPVAPALPRKIQAAKQPRAPRPPSVAITPRPPRTPLAPWGRFELTSPPGPRAPFAPRGRLALAAPPAPPAPPAPRVSWSRVDWGLSYVIVGKGGSASVVSASAADLREALALHKELKDEYLWVQRRGKRVVITDPEAIASLRPLLDEQRSLRDRETELNVSQAELARRQAELGKQQAQMGTKHAELGLKRAELGVRRAELDVKRMETKLKAQLVPRPHNAKDGPNQLSASERKIADLARMEAELKAKQEDLGKQQSELGRKSSELGQQQGELGRQQGELGRQQGELGRKLGDFTRQRARQGARLSHEVDRIVDQQTDAGKARVLPPATQ